MSMKPSAPLQTWRRMLPAAVAALTLCGTLLPAPAAFAQSAAARARGETARGEAARGAPVTLNFVNADIEGVARAMSAILKQQFIVDPRV